MERWTYQRPFELGRADRSAISWCSPTTSPPTTAPGWCTSPPHSAPRTSRSAGPTACRWSTRSRATALLARRGAGRRRVLQGRRREAGGRPAARGLLFRHLPYEHSYPHCWRCHTPLMYYAQPSWYVRTTAIKDALLAENEATNWYPSTIKHGRYGDWLNNNVDWALSRDRYWGTPLPIWRNDADPPMVCVGSLAELRAGRCRSGRPAPSVRRRRDVHLPGETVATARVPEVIDAWFDSGSMPFAQFGAPYRNERARPGPLPGRLHLRGHRPDPRLVLHADGDRDAGLRPELVRERAVPGSHPGRGRPQDEQAPGQHPRADAADGRARRRCAALVHGLRRLAVGPRRVGHTALDEIVRKVLRTYWYTASFQALYAGHRRAGRRGVAAPAAARPRPARPVGLSEMHRATAEVDAALEDFDTQRAGTLLAGVHRRPVELVRPAFTAAVLGRRPGRAGDPARVPGTLTRLLAPFIAVHHREGVGRRCSPRPARSTRCIWLSGRSPTTR